MYNMWWHKYSVHTYEKACRLMDLHDLGDILKQVHEDQRVLAL